MALFKKILIANRGEIAVRVIKAAAKLGIRTVAIYSSADEGSLHVRLADEAYSLNSNELAESYLNIEKIIQIAKISSCQAIHPGYGFLAENPAFVSACNNAGLVFIGPDAQAMKLMGNKVESREALKDAGIPMTAGITGTLEELLAKAGQIKLPILVKAAAGGGGKGMRIVHDLSKLAETLESTSREAKAYFGDGTVFIEKFVEEPRHIEIQVLGDNYGNVIHLYERECSIQRRYQKIIEESPSPTLTDEVRIKMGETAVRIAKKIGYSNAGTVEFLVDKDLNFYFLEMNTRVQVEHPVTEMVTGFDIVKEQILVASGKKLDIKQEDIHQNGHAIECRIYAEDPENNFLPSPGKMTLYIEPAGDGLRIDSAIDRACTIESFYDPMICKLILWGEDREIAREKMIHALDHFVVHGIRTNIAYLRQLMAHPNYIANNLSTKFCDEHTVSLIKTSLQEKEAIAVYLPIIAYYLYEFNIRKREASNPDYHLWQQISYWRDVMILSGEIDNKAYSTEIENIRNNSYTFIFNNEPHKAALESIDMGCLNIKIDEQPYRFFVSKDENGQGYISLDSFNFRIRRNDVLSDNAELLGSYDQLAKKGSGKIVSPMPGKVIKINVKEGDQVRKGNTLMIVEAMKMENHITSPSDGIVEKVNVKQGDMVNGSTRLIELKKSDKQAT